MGGRRRAVVFAVGLILVVVLAVLLLSPARASLLFDSLTIPICFGVVFLVFGGRRRLIPASRLACGPPLR